MLLSDKSPLENVTKTSYPLELITSWDMFAAHNWLQRGGVLVEHVHVEHVHVFKKFRVHTTREIFKNLLSWGTKQFHTHTSGSFSLIGYISAALHHWAQLWASSSGECHSAYNMNVMLKCIECPPAQTMRMSSIWYPHQPRESQYACPVRKHSGSCPKLLRLFSPICRDSTQLHVCT